MQKWIEAFGAFGLSYDKVGDVWVKEGPSTISFQSKLYAYNIFMIRFYINLNIQPRASAKKFPRGDNGKPRLKNSTNKPPSTVSVAS